MEQPALAASADDANGSAQIAIIQPGVAPIKQKYGACYFHLKAVMMLARY